MSGIEVVTEDDISSVVESEPGTGDEAGAYEYHDELEYDAGEEDGEAASEEAAAAECSARRVERTCDRRRHSHCS